MTRRAIVLAAIVYLALSVATIVTATLVAGCAPRQACSPAGLPTENERDMAAASSFAASVAKDPAAQPPATEPEVVATEDPTVPEDSPEPEADGGDQ